MRYMLDTHAFIWKIAIKTSKRKLNLGGILNEDLIDVAERMGIRAIELSPDEAATYGDLMEDTHFDPFDRMLIWQAICRKMILVSGDPEFQRFIPDGLKLLW